jgi:hypothetical protein
MRAYTSLAGHILGSHPAINGYFEMHISYDDPSALDQQLEKFREQETIKENSHYLFDKLLHNDYQLRPEQLGLVDIKILLTLRQPEQTIKSIVDLFANKDTAALYALPTEATRYYIERLEWLADFSRKNVQAYDYYDAELLKSAPDTLLPAISSWLGLDSPLRERYRLFSQTGVARKGDSSKIIQSGRIAKTKIDRSHIRIPNHVLKSALTVYRDCRQQVIDNARDAVSRS